MAYTNLINGINLTPTNSLVHLLDSNDTDDNNEVPIVKHSAYYGENDFSSMLANKAGLTILSGNIQSIKAKFDELEAFINRVNTSNPISLICLQECWLEEKNIESIAMFNLKDYNMSYQTKQCCGHGGLIIYVHTQFTCTPIDTISQAATGWEYMCVELSHQTPRSPKYLVCNVYRKPGELREDFNLFLQEFASFTLKVKRANKSSYICGDYNIDLLKIQRNAHFNEFFDNLISCGFFPKITLPTRIAGQSASLIDNIFSNNIDEREKSGILLNHISDHQLIFTYIEHLSYIQKVPKFVEVEKVNSSSIKKSVEELENLNIYDDLNKSVDSSPHLNYDTFINLVQYAKNKHIPRKQVKYQKKKHKKSKWMTTGILNSINTKDRMYKLLLKTDPLTDRYMTLKARFKTYRETLRRSINEAKKMYYQKVFGLYRNDMKKTWLTIKETLQRNQKHDLPVEFLMDNRRLTNPDEIANEFNAYFINIGRSLSDQIQSQRSSHEYLGDRANTNFTFTAVNEECIDTIVKNMKSKSSTGYDEISNKLIKQARSVLVKPLTLLMNPIIHTGEFPDQLKLSRVKPLFKKGDQCCFSNYRPISLLPSISKIFEHVIADQLTNYLTSNHLFCLEQFGFRPGHSTELAALQLVNHIITEMDNYNVPTNIYLDLSKAFDTLNFDILLNKLDHYGIQGCSNRLLRSYLTGRMQYVEYNGHKSAHLPISTGVPQGSVLGPLLFLIYINDLPLVSNVFKMLMYADDTTLYCNIDQNVDEDTINNELAKIWEWLIANKLSLNTKKTKYMVFHTNQRNVTYPNLVINNIIIERVSHFNFLGIMLSYNMIWDAHINHISKKISKAIGILYQLKHIYPQRILFTLYTTLIVPHLNYCLIL